MKQTKLMKKLDSVEKIVDDELLDLQMRFSLARDKIWTKLESFQEELKAEQEKE